MTREDKGIKRLINSFKFAINGLIDTYRTEQTVWLYIPVSIIVIALGFILKIDKYEWLAVILVLGIILSLELVNTAIESAINLETLKYHPLAKKAKDTASAAVLVFAIVSVIIGIIIFLPKVIALF